MEMRAVKMRTRICRQYSQVNGRVETTPQERGVIEAGMACAWVTLGYETMHVARIVIACRAVSRCEWWTVGKQGQSVTLHQRSREIQLRAGFGASRASEGLGTTCYLLLRLLAAILIHVPGPRFLEDAGVGGLDRSV